MTNCNQLTPLPFKRLTGYSSRRFGMLKNGGKLAHTNRGWKIYLLIALAVELFQLVGEVVDRLLMTFLETCLRRLMLDGNQLQVLLQLLDLMLSTPANLTLQHVSFFVTVNLAKWTVLLLALTYSVLGIFSSAG